MSIFVGNLAFEITEDDLKAVFNEYGSVARVTLPVDRETGRKRGIAFVEMKSTAQEEKAILELDGADWMGRTLRLSPAKPREKRGDFRKPRRRN